MMSGTGNGQFNIKLKEESWSNFSLAVRVRDHGQRRGFRLGFWIGIGFWIFPRLTTLKAKNDNENSYIII